MSDRLHQLKITLRGIRPPIWRRIRVASDISLGELAAVIEAAMGWDGAHLHVFEVGPERYSNVAFEIEDDEDDENQFTVAQVFSSEGQKVNFIYDFGDFWEHEVLVEKIEAKRPGESLPVCVAGKRACPPEDCGGPWGYGEILKLLADPALPDPDEIRDWLHPDFDPERFDPDWATLAMRNPRPWEFEGDHFD